MYDKILVPLDGSKTAECVIPHVIKIAKECRVKEIYLLRVCMPVSVLADYPADMPETWEQHAKDINYQASRQCSIYLDTVEEQLKKAGLDKINVIGKLGDPANEIIDFIEENGIGLVIMASHGRSGPSRWVFGSVAEKVSRTVQVPVMIIHETHSGK
ncbi:MAG: universal stress protein [Dehalococcoidales bacterium]|nr:universal stress protein [Dehalococcoidales bacterium]